LHGFLRRQLWREAPGERICGTEDVIEERKGGFDLEVMGKSWRSSANKPISLFGRNSASGTYGYFKEHALSKGDYKSTVKEQPGSSAVVQGVASDISAIGYSGIGYITSGVKAVPLGEEAGKFVEEVMGKSWRSSAAAVTRSRPSAAAHAIILSQVRR
jgi:ABC-type phosphate transport system substrate-binding protein